MLLGNKIIKCSCLRRMTYKVVWSCTFKTPIGQDLFVCNLSLVFIFIFMAKLVIQPSYWRQLLHVYMWIPNHSKNFRKSSENHCWLKRVYFDPFQLHVDLPLSMLHLDFWKQWGANHNLGFSCFRLFICHKTSLGLTNLPFPVRIKQPRDFCVIVNKYPSWTRHFLFPALSLSLVSIWTWVKRKGSFFVFGLLLLSTVKLYFILSSTKLNLCQQTDFNGSHQTKLLTKG